MFKVMTSDALEQYSMEKHDEPQVVVQITQVAHTPAFIMPYRYNGIKDKLELVFNDTLDVDRDNLYMNMQLNHAYCIKQFVEKHLDDADVLIIAQDKTKDRAEGIIKALAEYYNQDISDIENNPRYCPNSLCYKLMMQVLNS